MSDRKSENNDVRLAANTEMVANSSEFDNSKKRKKEKKEKKERKKRDRSSASRSFRRSDSGSRGRDRRDRSPKRAKPPMTRSKTRASLGSTNAPASLASVSVLPTPELIGNEGPARAQPGHISPDIELVAPEVASPKSVASSETHWSRAEGAADEPPPQPPAQLHQEPSGGISAFETTEPVSKKVAQPKLVLPPWSDETGDGQVTQASNAVSKLQGLIRWTLRPASASPASFTAWIDIFGGEEALEQRLCSLASEQLTRGCRWTAGAAWAAAYIVKYDLHLQEEPEFAEVFQKIRLSGEIFWRLMRRTV